MYSVELKIAAVVFVPFILLELYFCYKRIRKKLNKKEAYEN